MLLGERRYLDAARNAAGFIRREMYRDGRLARSYREGTGPEGFAEDYASMCAAALDLYEAGGEIAWLQWALELQERLDTLFLDADHGGYFSARAGDTSILVRMKEDHDGAEPAASSLAARNSLRLARMLDDSGLESRAGATIRAFADQLRGMPAMLTALLFSESEPRQIVIAGPPDQSAPLARVAREFATPETILVYADGAEGQTWLAGRLPFIRTAVPVDGRAAAYVCENFACQLPVTDPATLRGQIS